MPGRADNQIPDARPARRQGDRSPRGRFHGALNEHLPHLKAKDAQPLRHAVYGLLAGTGRPIEMSGATDEQWTALRGELEWHLRDCPGGEDCGLLAEVVALVERAERRAA